jgi:hypothetical protein
MVAVFLDFGQGKERKAFLRPETMGIWARQTWTLPMPAKAIFIARQAWLSGCPFEL